MRSLMLIFMIISSAFASAGAGRDSLMRRLDAALADRGNVALRKEARIDSLKNILSRTKDLRGKSALLGRLYDEYLTYNFDSTMAYVGKAEIVADGLGDPGEKARVQIRKALSLATSGHFSQAADILGGISASSLPAALRKEYYSACEWTYGVWAEYSGDNVFSPRYKEKSIDYLDSLIKVMTPGEADYDYRRAEKHFRLGEFEEAEKAYLKAVGATPVNSRLYAQAAYALAVAYKELGDERRYREWLIKAAISDQVTPLKENLALQQLALCLKTDDEDMERANRYLRISLEDAIFYNNRLRMLEIAEKFPEITMEYQDAIASQNRRLRLSLTLIAALVAGMGVAIWQLGRQIKKRRMAMEAREQIAAKLAAANEKLMETNRVREQYTSLFVDLCGAYIDKLNRFPGVLRLKVKQLSDLNSVADRYVRPSEAEIREMFFNFDTAFLKLYPDFIEEFNKLLLPDKRIYPRDKELLNTDLRIYSLIRMGITDSNRIASLLFYSPQTIFNHRTSVRNRAIDRATFEQDVMRICRVV